MNIHPAANEFPLMEGQRLNELVGDIEANGLRVPIALYDGDILDGRNRKEACEQLGIEPRYQEVKGDPYQYVLSMNISRRDLVKEQRYLIWLECSAKSEVWQAEQKRIADEANAKRSVATKAQPRSESGHFDTTGAATSCGDTGRDHHVEAAAKTSAAKATTSGTNRGAVERGDKLSKARPDLAKSVRMGELKPAAAHREMRQDEVAGAVSALPTDKYTVIYADPPWKYNDAQAVKGDYGTGTGSAQGHYPAMTISELKALNVASLAADNSVLFLWATSPLLVDALSLASAWGFKYKSSFIWDKVKHNMGHYNSVRHEFLLICTRGSCTPHYVKLFDSVQSIERTGHSEKPELFREIIDTLYIHGEKLELFRRGDAPKGWHVWGNEVVHDAS